MGDRAHRHVRRVRLIAADPDPRAFPQPPGSWVPGTCPGLTLSCASSVPWMIVIVLDS
jgi:hypothetical protein